MSFPPGSKTTPAPAHEPAADPFPHLFTLVSLTAVKELILDVLRAAEASAIAEIGSESGAFTEILCAFARESGKHVTTIDPLPQPAGWNIIQAHGNQPYFQFLQKTSLEALPGLQADAYVIDGDHNYYTVRRELELIWENRPGKPWVAVLHDVGWPCARRDTYYNPTAIPSEHLHPHSHDAGITVGNPGVVNGGNRSSSVMAFALAEGGPANGVRTAVEDFAAAHPEFEFAAIPSPFGLGVLYSKHAPWSDRMAKLVAPFAANPLLERMEANRINLSLRVFELSNELAARDKELAQVKKEAKRPKSPEGLRLLATAFFIEQDWAEAGSLLQTLVRYFPDDIDVWQARLECARQRNHRAHARIIRQDALRLHPEWSAILGDDSAPASRAA